MMKYEAMETSAQMQRRRFSIREIERMLEAGIVDEDEPLELLAGELVLMSPQNPRHAALTEKIRRLLERFYAADTHTRTHSPMEAGADSLPEPDIGLFRGDVDAYLDRHPRGSDALLVVEIAATSHTRDRAKAGIYSRAGVPVYWLVDLEKGCLEVRSQPQVNKGYSVARILEDGDRVELPVVGTEIPVTELLG